MNFEELQALDAQYVMQTYGRFPVAVDHGKGATLWDVEGKEYIDFASGIGVNSVGYANEKWQAAIYEQAARLGHISNLFYSEPYAHAGTSGCASAPAWPRPSLPTRRRRGQRGHDQAGPEVLL